MLEKPSLRRFAYLILVTLIATDPAAAQQLQGDTPDGPLERQVTLRVGPDVISVSRDAGGGEALTLNRATIASARHVPLVFLARLPAATVIVFEENDINAGCEAPPAFLSIYPDRSYLVDRSMSLDCREFDVARAGDGLSITPAGKAARRWSPMVPTAATSPSNDKDAVYRDAMAALGRRDYTKAISELETLVEQGHPQAMSALGGIHANGEGVPADPLLAMALMHRAADMSEAHGQYGVGVLYQAGRGARRDPELAVLYLRRAAQQGHVAAQARLGRMLSRGDGIRRDDAEAGKWLRLASERGNQEAKAELAEVEARAMSSAAVAPPAAAAPPAPPPQAAAVGAGWRDLGNGITFLYGMTRQEFLATFPRGECLPSGSACGFPRSSDAAAACPGGGGCPNGLAFDMRGGRIVGFQATYSQATWERLYRATEALYGRPRSLAPMAPEAVAWTLSTGEGLSFSKLELAGRPTSYTIFLRAADR